jgi:hypothetical protein
MIGVHPRALLEFDDQEPGLQNEIRELMKGYDSRLAYSFDLKSDRRTITRFG